MERCAGCFSGRFEGQDLYMKPTLFDQKASTSFPKLIEDFLTYQRTEKDASHHTIVNYEIDLRHWIAFYTKNHPGPLDLIQLSSLKSLR